MAMRLRHGAVTHEGRIRPGNEDALLAEDDLFAVADGMGGHVAGEVASRIAIETLRAERDAGVVEAIRRANRAIVDRSSSNPTLRGMGTTLCAVTIVDGGGSPLLQIANVGDSRAYLFRGGELHQVTDDHSYVGELEREGRLTREEARAHPQRNIITRNLGDREDVEVDLFEIDPFRGDRVLLCSDGLVDEITDDAIADVLRRTPDPEEAAARLVDLANEAGGHDNITVVVVDVVDDGSRALSASAALAGDPLPDRQAPAPAPADETATWATIGGGATRPPRRFTWRVGVFVALLAAVVAAAGAGIWWVGRGTYYVGLDGDRVAVFRGRPGGVLWVQPTLEERSELTIDDVPRSSEKAVRDGQEYGSRAEARRYVRRLAERSPTTTATTTTLVPLTTTTVAPAPQ